MSFDPFHEQQPQRDPAPRPPLDPFAANAPAPIVGAAPSAARERVMFPAILLIIVAVLNLLFALLCLGLTVFITPAFLEKTMNDPNQPDAIRQIMAQNAKTTTPEQMAAQAKVQYGFLGGANLLSALLALLAGIRMLQLRNYGLVFFGAILSAIPCVSGSGCCCIGEVAGLYAVIMLLQTDIRDAFR